MKTGRPRKPRSKPLPVGGWVPRTERLASPPPPREPGEDDCAYYLRTLPMPPTVASDESVCEWLSDVAYVAGAAGLSWAFDAFNFPEHLKPWRMRVDHHFHVLMRNLELQAQREREAAARATQANLEDERQAKRRAAGWS